MGQKQIKARAVRGPLWALLAGTFTRRSTPLTVLDLLGPARPTRQPLPWAPVHSSLWTREG
jgi:hypothetical protein